MNLLFRLCIIAINVMKKLLNYRGSYIKLILTYKHKVFTVTKKCLELKLSQLSQIINSMANAQI